MNIVENNLLVMLVFALIFCVMLPAGGYIYVRIKYGKRWQPFLFGALAFFVSQIVLRIPIIQYVLPQITAYNVFTAVHPYIYSIFMGLTAGIFEEVFRYLIIRIFLKKKRDFADALAFGFGHGGIEVLLITGISYLNLFLYAVAAKSGQLDQMLTGAPQTAIDSIYATLASLSIGGILLGMIERIFAMALHIGLTTIVFRGFAKKKAGIYLFAAILIHGLVDSMCGILPLWGANGIIIELVLGIFAAAMVFYTLKVKREYRA